VVPTHIPVFLTEVIELINVQPAGTYIDATFGRGGHSRSLLERLSSDGRLLAIDRDPEAIVSAKRLASIDPRLTVAKSPFSQLGEVAADLHGQVDGVVFDLGISSPQVDDAGRGFSFRADGPLDMRMDPESSVSAADWLHGASEKEISDVLWQYGDERRSRQIARRIVDTRKSSPITTTFELASLVRSCVAYKGGRIDPATRTFQAIRLRVNDELGELQLALEAAFELLAVGGRVLVIAFHSLEDRIVKRRFRDLDRLRRVSDKSGQSISPAFALLTSKPVMASEAERRANPRSRSARLRALERTV
jgi:16S rRNA (cytosine1402-N4)-methyltransferase